MQDSSGISFARATNAATLGLYGDPERWGSQDSVTTHTNYAEFSKQLVRAQCAGLWSTAWDICMTWAQIGGDALDPNEDKLTCVAELTIGNGQTSTLLNWVPMAQNVRNGQAAFLGLTANKVTLADPYYGAALITVPACAIAGRIAVAIQGPNQPVKSATFEVTLQCAPRVGVQS